MASIYNGMQVSGLSIGLTLMVIGRQLEMDGKYELLIYEKVHKKG